MIELIGEEDTSEYQVALSLRDGFIQMWPGIDKSPEFQEIIKIVVGTKISGYGVSDIDVVVCGLFNKERRFIPRKVIHDMSGGRVVRKPVLVNNFAIVVEVKDHEEDLIQLNGDNIMVKYKNGWKSATDQNIKQVHSLVAYFNDLGKDIYIHRCLVMQGLSKLRAGGAVSAAFDGVDFLTSVSSVSRVRKTSKGYELSSGVNSDFVHILNAPIFRLVIPSNLDRRKMDSIVTATRESKLLLENIGKKMVTLRGHGGSGKTVMLLQMAWKAFEEKGTRTLVLTYNHALAADIRRSLSLLRVPSEVDRGGILVSTVMSFMYSWFNRLGLIDKGIDSSLEEYESYCESALELLKEGAISRDDINNAITSYPDRFDFDCIAVDEAQDWPQSEADLLKALYFPRNIALADGIDQLLRGSRPDWNHGVEESERLLLPLKRCLRMKRNLALFSNQVACISGIRWEVKPNNEAAGGRIILLKKSFDSYPKFLSLLIEKAKAKGNSEIDFLLCVPPNNVIDKDGERKSLIGDSLKSKGYSVWDGVDQKVRKDFPRSLDQFRIVQYKSCRGLEGWTVILHGADQYWESCREIRESEGLTAEEKMAFTNIQEVSNRDAWHKMLIALTRPIDTLVIDLLDLESNFSKQIMLIAKKFPDIVEVVD